MRFVQDRDSHRRHRLCLRHPHRSTTSVRPQLGFLSRSRRASFIRRHSHACMPYACVGKETCACVSRLSKQPCALCLDVHFVSRWSASVAGLGASCVPVCVCLRVPVYVPWLRVSCGRSLLPNIVRYRTRSGCRLKLPSKYSTKVVHVYP